jgi:endonuclease/exonuclease/phosphatase family metal-dependent hydrolase
VEGGGIVHCYFSSLDLDIVNVHLASGGKRVCNDQLNFLSGYLRDLNKNLIFMGDFNLSYNLVGNYFPNLALVSGEVRTCSTTPIMNWFYDKDVDHILVRGFERKGDVGVMDGMSDHKLVYVDLALGNEILN